MSRQLSRHLKRLWKSSPLPLLNQGSTLSVRSNIPNTHLILCPEWKDSGHVEFQQIFESSTHNELQQPVEMTVRQEKDQITSMGRPSCHIAIDVHHLLAASPNPSKKHDTNPTEPNLVSATMPFRDHVIPHTTAVIKEEGEDSLGKIILDDGSIRPDSSEFQQPELPNGARRIEYHDGIAHVTGEQNQPQHQSSKAVSSSTEHDPSSNQEHDPLPPGVFLTVQVPEKVNLDCQLLSEGGSITIGGKIEGDVKLSTMDGDIRVKKLRGHHIDLQTTSPTASSSIIYSSDLLEAQKLTVRTSGRFRAKQVHGSNVQVAVSVKHERGESGSRDQKASERHHLPLEDDDEASLIDISALYISGQGGASLEVTADSSSPLPYRPSARAVRVKTSHGPIQVDTTNLGQPTEINAMTGESMPLVELGGVNGNCELSLQKKAGKAPPLSSVVSDSDHFWSSCLVHIDSLAPESVSVVSCDMGNINITLDRKTEADLRLLTAPSSEFFAETISLLAEEEDSSMVVDVLGNLPVAPKAEASAQSQPQQPLKHSDEDDNGSIISIETRAFTETNPPLRMPNGIKFLEGWVENNSKEPDSRFERKLQGDSTASIGKIRLEGAADQALHGFTSNRSSSNSNGGSNETTSTTTSIQKEEEFLRPLLAVAGTGSISVETVSWLGAIARRYGLDEDSGRELGRTASRRGRSVLVPTTPPTE